MHGSDEKQIPDKAVLAQGEVQHPSVLQGSLCGQLGVGRHADTGGHRTEDGVRLINLGYDLQGGRIQTGLPEAGFKLATGTGARFPANQGLREQCQAGSTRLTECLKPGRVGRQ